MCRIGFKLDISNGFGCEEENSMWIDFKRDICSESIRTIAKYAAQLYVESSLIETNKLDVESDSNETYVIDRTGQI